ncbi:hypothetical protein RN001_015871 [Aquatica leii]|uniref:Trimethyllysine dioxygenase, mitochondrial n=1 Tax=Aquatica leii TaxID=1421715 RepID=A0AAN7PNJ3_9COLE|nr:hypothetical protein RN001_015871 [Aquatica leii]
MDSLVKDLGAMKLYDTYIDVEIGANNKRFYYIWLRDNCRCEKCYSTFFNQILNFIFEVPLTIKPINCEIINDKLNIEWDDGHRSEYALNWLDGFEFEYKTKMEMHLWDQNIEKKIDDIIVPVDVYYKDVDGVKALAGNILKYGFGIVSGVELSAEATEEVVKRFASVKKTCFGEMWHVRSDSDYNDTSSTQVGLLAHNDNTYFSSQSGLQVFHLIHHNGKGGSTVLVDGFNIANIIKNKNQEAFETLCTVPVPAHFIDKNHHFVCTEPMIQLHPVTKEFYKIRFNIYDRSPLTSVKNEAIYKFYEALIMFGKLVNDRKNEYAFKLQPGQVIFIDNWRILHGRTAYTGTRDIAGCYISRDDFMSSAKRLYPELQ